MIARFLSGDDDALDDIARCGSPRFLRAITSLPITVLQWASLHLLAQLPTQIACFPPQVTYEREHERQRDRKERNRYDKGAHQHDAAKYDAQHFCDETLRARDNATAIAEFRLSFVVVHEVTQ